MNLDFNDPAGCVSHLLKGRTPRMPDSIPPQVWKVTSGVRDSAVFSAHLTSIDEFKWINRQ